MKKFLPLIIILISSMFLSIGANAEESATFQTQRVQISAGTREVKLVRVDMKDPLYRAEVVIAGKQIGKVESFSDLVKQPADQETEIIAAINGTFFNASSDLQPTGNIQMKGKNIYLTNGTSVGFSADNTVKIDYLYTTVNGSVNGMWEYPYNWSVWGINQVYSSSDANILYTPEFGKQVDAGGKTAIIIQNKKVVEIKKGIVPIHSDGYTLVFGAEVYASRFKVGDSVDYKLEYNQIDFSNGMKKGESIDWSDVRSTIGAGPLLVKDGKIVQDINKEGYTDAKFTGGAQRSFIGVTKDNVLLMGTVSKVSLAQLAEVLVKLGVENGMNLDGGASSALYFKGQVVTEPGRKLSNAIVITRRKTRPIRLQLNGKELFLDTDPYFENNTTMVPMRGIMEALGAEVGWDPATGTLWAEKGDIRVELWNGSSTVRVNGAERTLLAPCRVVNNRTHVPARFMTELFGGDVAYDKPLNMVVMKLDDANPSELYEKAVKAYDGGNRDEGVEMLKKLLEGYPNHAGALLKLARHYAQQSDNSNAGDYYEKYLAIQTMDYDAWNSLGWIYSNMGDLSRAIEVFSKLTREKPEAAAYWIALGDMYAHYQIQDTAKARQCYEKALSLSVSESQKQGLQDRLKKLP